MAVVLCIFLLKLRVFRQNSNTLIIAQFWYDMENEFLKLAINTIGAELKSLVVKESGREILWQADPKVWPRHAPVLFPVVGKLKNDSYFFNNTSYSLKQHGFARDLEHKKISSGEYLLSSSKDTIEKYPFQFSLATKYQLNEKKLQVNYSVKNLGIDVLPFSIGAHPGFRLQNTKNVKIEFEHQEIGYFLLNNGQVDFSKRFDCSRVLDLNPTSFNNDALIFKNLKSSWVKLFDGDQNNELILSMHFNDLPYFGIWSKVVDNKISFICLEPWWGVADTTETNQNIFDKEGINLIAPSESMDFSYIIEVNI